MKTEEELANFLAAHKVHPDNQPFLGQYDPNPFRLAEEIFEFLDLKDEKEKNNIEH